MRNMELYAILISQRCQDVNTYFRCRVSQAIGKIALDDWDLKIKKLLSPISNKERILAMPKGCFYFTAINDLIQFPLFQPSKPEEWKPKPIEQPKAQPKNKKSLFDIMREIFRNQPNSKYLDQSYNPKNTELEKESREDSQADLYLTEEAEDDNNLMFPEEFL